MGIKVIVVDDIADIRLSIVLGLKDIDSSYQFKEAASSEEFFKVLKDWVPDVVLMDIMLPGMDGLDTVIQLKQNPDYENVKVIFLTAKTDPLTKGVGELSGEDFIEKPFDPVNLDQRIKSVVGKASPNG